MSDKSNLSEFVGYLKESQESGTFIELILSQYHGSHSGLKTICIRPVLLRGEIQYSADYRFEQRAESKNYSGEQLLEMMTGLLKEHFNQAHLFTDTQDVVFNYNKKKKEKIYIKKPTKQKVTNFDHNKTKQHLIPSDRPFLKQLGISGADGTVYKNKYSKFRQINRYVEIMDHLLRDISLAKEPVILDMGSGKGYLTFALYDYFRHIGNQVQMRGYELREDLVNFCNTTAKELGFDGLRFEAKDINSFNAKKSDVLIALHACDTATDIAIAKGIQSNAELIVCVPCCHKQIRKQIKCNGNLQSVLKHGILEERQAELITDGIRSLILEQNGYKTKVFEFVSTTHTPKNLMIAATKHNQKTDIDFYKNKINALKTEYGIESHYLETLL